MAPEKQTETDPKDVPEEDRRAEDVPEASLHPSTVRPLCIFHGNCADGFTSAWVVYNAIQRYGWQGVDFHPGVYQDPPPAIIDRDVIMVDFSYKAPIMAKIMGAARSVLVLDHHKSAMEELAGLPRLEESTGYPAFLEKARDGYYAEGNCAVVFDMERSGARITWDFFNPGHPPPIMLEHIEDRDLWRFKHPDTRAAMAYMFSFPYEFETWDHFMSLTVEADGYRDALLEGEAIERKHFKDIDELIGVTRRLMVIGGRMVPVANLPYTLSSDAGHRLAKGFPFAACYWDTPDGRVFSLRSEEGKGEDVSKVAAQYGGGGHKHAAGFRTVLGWNGDR